MIQVDLEATRRTRARYERIAPIYDLMEGLAERRYRPWRERLWSLVKGPEVLEVGVGTGKNMTYYSAGLQITGIDLAPGMLARARERATALSLDVQLFLGDVQTLDFADNAFDTVVSTFVFCSVPNPVLGLREIHRVVKPGGQVLLLEHVRSERLLWGALMDFLNPLVVRVVGANINRRTVENVRRASLRVDQVDDLGFGGIFKLIRASKETAGSGRSSPGPREGRVR